MTPQQAADKALKAIDPTTAVSTDSTAVVAGRTAYQLVLEPRDTTAWSAPSGSRSTEQPTSPPASRCSRRAPPPRRSRSGFTSFDPSTPAPSVFGFNPPPGATVTEHAADRPVPPRPTAAPPRPRAGSRPTSSAPAGPRVLVASVPGDTSGSSGSSGSGSLGTLSSTMKSLPTVSGSWGSGHLLEGTVFSAVLTDDGRLAIGAVPPAALYDALSAS